MKSRTILTLFLIFYLSSCNVMETIDNYYANCEFPPKLHLFEEDSEEYHGHPYQFVNRDRDLTPVNIFKKEVGDKNAYKIVKELGSGTFGSVFKAIHTPTTDEVALKMLLHSREEQISKEVLILRELKDAPNFLPIRDVLREQDDNGDIMIGLVLDFFPAQSFGQIYQNLDAFQVKVLIFQTMRTLEYAHSRGIMHRDIKPLNVLMDPQRLQVRVIDWGQAEYYVPGKNFTTGIATLFYAGPELILGYQYYDYSLDVWEAGIMLLEMSFKEYHFIEPNRTLYPKDPKRTVKEEKKVTQRAQLDAITRVFGTKDLKEYAEKFKDRMNNLDILNYIGDHEGEPLTNFITDKTADMIDPLLIDLIYKMLVYDHTKRITMKQALEHPYFDEIREEYGRDGFNI